MSDKKQKRITIFSLILCILGAITVNILMFIVWSAISVSESDMNPLLITASVSVLNLVICPVLFIILRRRHIRILITVYSFLSAVLSAVLIFPLYTFCTDSERYGEFGAYSIIPLLILFLTGCVCTGVFTMIIRKNRRKEMKLEHEKSIAAEPVEPA